MSMSNSTANTPDPAQTARYIPAAAALAQWAQRAGRVRASPLDEPVGPRDQTEKKPLGIVSHINVFLLG